MPVQKQVADLLTIIRTLLAILLLWLGLKQGSAGLSAAVLVLILAWTSDILDGPLARRSQAPRQTWVCDHDLQADVILSTGLLAYMAFAGYWNLLVAGTYALFWALVFRLQGLDKTLGSLFQSVIYGSFIWVALREAPAYGRWLLAWITGAIVLTWPRFPRVLVPEFLANMRRLLAGHRSTQNQHNNC